MSQFEGLPLENEPTQSMLYTKMDHTEPLRGEFLQGLAAEMRYGSEEPLSPPEEGKLKWEVADRLFDRSMYEKIAAVDAEAGLSLGGLHRAMREAQTLPPSRPIEHELYKAQELEDEFTVSIIEALRATGLSQTISEDQLVSGSRLIVTEKIYDEFLALQTGQVDIVKGQITEWQTSGQELEQYQKDIARELDDRKRGQISQLTAGQEYYNLRGLNVSHMGQRYLYKADAFANRTRQSPIDYVEETEVESAKQTFLNAVTAYEPVAVQETGSPLGSPEEILREIAARKNLPFTS